MEVESLHNIIELDVGYIVAAFSVMGGVIAVMWKTLLKKIRETIAYSRQLEKNCQNELNETKEDLTNTRSELSDLYKAIYLAPKDNTCSNANCPISAGIIADRRKTVRRNSKVTNQYRRRITDEKR